MNNNTFTNNSADYGPDIASYAVKIRQKTTNNTKIILDESPSGLSYNGSLSLELVDYDGQIMNQQSSKVVKINAVTPNASISGINYAKFTEGVAEFPDLVFESIPGSTNVKYSLTSSAIDSSVVSAALSNSSNEFNSELEVNFRFCKPGEALTTSNTCRECSFGTYSLFWNSTQCKNCMDNAVCSGTNQIQVEEGYWRSSQESETIVECLRTDSCLGGFNPTNVNPISCEEGYEGLL